MATTENLDARCRQAIEVLNDRERWGLSQQQRGDYAEQILRRVPAAMLEARLEEVVRHFHADHPLVAALGNPHSAAHARAWAWVEGEIIRVTQTKGLAWSRDRAVEIDDLVQTVQAEVVRVIGDFHYGSSLRTWLQSVTVRRLRRYHRDSSAAKRRALAVPLDEAAEQPVDWGELEQQVMVGALVREIDRILSTTGDKRYAQIFHLHTVGGQPSEEIGRRVQLHASRVRALLKLARSLLSEDAGLRSWRNGDRDEGAHGGG